MYTQTRQCFDTVQESEIIMMFFLKFQWMLSSPFKTEGTHIKVQEMPLLLCNAADLNSISRNHIKVEVENLTPTHVLCCVDIHTYTLYTQNNNKILKQTDNVRDNLFKSCSYHYLMY